MKSNLRQLMVMIAIILGGITIYTVFNISGNAPIGKSFVISAVIVLIIIVAVHLIQIFAGSIKKRD